MRTLAIDASTKSSGIAIFDQGKLIHYQCIIKQGETLTRVKKMAEAIAGVCIKYHPSDVVMEQVLPEDVKHNQSVYKALIYLQAAIALQLHQIGYSINFYTASHWRSVCGIKVGRGIKREELKAASQMLVKQIYKIDVNDDISDAICLGIAYLKQHRSAF